MKRVTELAKQTYYTASPRFTDFLSDRQQELAQAALNKIDQVCYEWDGGYPHAERKILVLLPETQNYTKPFCSLQIKPVQDVYLQHRDCLGAILGLGLDRKSIGDIVLQQDGSAILFCMIPAATLIEQHLTQIGKETVCVQNATQLYFEQEQQKTLHKTTVSSLRIDAILAAMLHYSREKALKLIQAGKVELNHLAVTTPHTQVYQDDLITVRNIGRFRLQEVGARTSKNRVFIQYYKY